MGSVPMRGNTAANGAGAESTLSTVVAHPEEEHLGGVFFQIVAMETWVAESLPMLENAAVNMAGVELALSTVLNESRDSKRVTEQSSRIDAQGSSAVE